VGGGVGGGMCVGRTGREFLNVCLGIKRKRPCAYCADTNIKLNSYLPESDRYELQLNMLPARMKEPFVVSFVTAGRGGGRAEGPIWQAGPRYNVVRQRSPPRPSRPQPPAPPLPAF